MKIFNKKSGLTPLDVGSWQERLRWSSVLLPSLIGLSALVLLSVATITTLPLIGWGHEDWAAVFSFIPGVLVGWTSVPKARWIPILATMVWYIPGMIYNPLLLPLFLGAVGLGIWVKSLTGTRAHGGPILAVLCLSIVSAIFYFWFVDGWRFIYAETDHFFYPTSSQYRGALEEAARHSLVRGDRKRALEILTRMERLGRRLPKWGIEYTVAALEVEAGAEQEAEALLSRVEPDVDARTLVIVDGYLARGDVAGAMVVADRLSERGKFGAYARIAEKEGVEGQSALARDAVKELFNLAHSNCQFQGDSDRCKLMIRLVPPATGDAYLTIAYIQSRSGLFADAVDTVRHHPALDQISAFMGLAGTALEMRRPNEARMIFATTRDAILTEPDPKKRDNLLYELAYKQSVETSPAVDAPRLLDDAEETMALIQDTQLKQTAAASIARGRDNQKTIERNVEDYRRSQLPKTR